MTNDPNLGDAAKNSSDTSVPPSSSQDAEFATPLHRNGATDGRSLWDWRSKYPDDARREIKFEALVLIFSLLMVSILAGLFLGLANYTLHLPLGGPTVSQIGDAGRASSPGLVLNIDFRLLALFFSGSVGGVTFSIKWLVHSTARGSWHVDRRYWRLMIPFLGGVYAIVVLTLFDAGFIGGAQAFAESRPISIAATFAFLVGYFSDGVSGLLSNVANAVFGTLGGKK